MDSSVADVTLLQELGEIVSDLTTSGSPSLDNNLLKKLKAICKKSEVYVNHTYHLVLTQLKKNHAEIRLSSFQVISELFFRSHAFRELLLIDFQIFLELTVETDPKQPLPPPKSVAKSLKHKVLQAIESWYKKFGPHYKKLDLGYNYLKRVKNVEFNAVTARTEAERRQSEERARRKRDFINGQIIRVENEMVEMISEMELCALEIENCFKLLLPHPDDFDMCHANEAATKTVILNNVPSSGQDQEEDKVVERHMSSTPSTSKAIDVLEEDESSELGVGTTESDVNTDKDDSEEQLLSNHGLGTRSYQLNIKIDVGGPQIRETDDNSIVLKTLKEMHKEMTHKHLPMINKWLSVLTKGEGTQQKIKQLIDLKRTLEATKDKFSELKITPYVDAMDKMSCIGESEDEEDDTDEFEDVPEKEGLELVIPPSKKSEYGLEIASTSNQSLKEDKETGFLKQYGANPRDLGDPTSRATALYQVRNRLADHVSSSGCIQANSTASDERKRKLLDIAPVVPYDMDLHFWGDPTANTHKLVKTYLDNNWASKEHEGEYVIGSEKEARPTRMVTFTGEFEPVKWSCRTPLPSGKLCPRRDRIKCPFHGKVIPRDETGTPVSKGAVTHTVVTLEENFASTSQEEAKDSRAADWKEVSLEIEAATGLDLGGKSRRKGKSKGNSKNKSKGSGLTDLKKQNNTTTARLEKIVLNKKAMKRVAHEMDTIATKRCREKFANQFNYSLQM
ncbi:UV-stimulated scaffold protein A-like isoform X1 [Montipora capricornis]|uniref:UV-stimulated scaffold protein A-like isoform X1 n=1 Tax=Montipora capricornis TaxID=246305 RepID=UPI0035F1C6B5